MIELLNLNFSNYLSYGPDNTVDFVRDKVTILSAENGYGKSSIATVLEDCLYSKNSRGILKAELQNRYLSEKPEATIQFRVGKDFYELTKTSTKATLFKNGDDISGHTATQTHKLIESIFGIDFTSFTKLVYQSINSNMDFLKETDANRKKFLIQLLGLEQYSTIEEELKNEAKNRKADLDKLEGEKKSLESFSIEVPDELVEIQVPELLEDNESAELRAQLAEIENIKSRNKKRRADFDLATKLKTDAKIKYERLVENRRKYLDKLLEHKMKEPRKVDFDPKALLEARKKLTQLETQRAEYKRTYQKFKTESEHTQCHVCKSYLDTSGAIVARDTAAEAYKKLGPEVTEITNSLTTLLENEKIYKEYINWQTELNRLEAGIPAEPEPVELPDPEPIVEEIEHDANSISTRLSELSSIIAKNRREIAEAQAFNKTVVANNAKRAQAQEQIIKRTEMLNNVLAKLVVVQQDYNDFVLLAKSTKELVSYKIESTIKLFEASINKYLVELSDGKFLITFKIDGSKLIVRLLSDKEEIKISSLSSGEYALLQVATLLAIRANVTKQGINLLILDEVISVLSDSNKDKLVQILLKEPYNSILVSHGYINSECGLLSISKSNNISRIEY